jgi:hypothetical protein
VHYGGVGDLQTVLGDYYFFISTNLDFGQFKIREVKMMGFSTILWPRVFLSTVLRRRKKKTQKIFLISGI